MARRRRQRRQSRQQDQSLAVVPRLDTPPPEPEPEPDGATALSLDEACSLLEQAEVVECKGLPWGSNYTFAMALQSPGGGTVLAIYKPRRGEVPLWDFPDGTLYRRERAAYLASQALGWTFVPPTVIREGPHGIGSVQLYIEPDPRGSYDLFRGAHRAELQRIALFDCVANNADRKAGHFLLGRADGRLWGIDHGLTFNVDSKLRTVVWDYVDEPVPEPFLCELEGLRYDPRRLDPLCADLSALLQDDEIESFVRRMDHMLQARRFPQPRSHRAYPWPPF